MVIILGKSCFVQVTPSQRAGQFRSVSPNPQRNQLWNSSQDGSRGDIPLEFTSLLAQTGLYKLLKSFVFVYLFFRDWRGSTGRTIVIIGSHRSSHTTVSARMSSMSILCAYEAWQCLSIGFTPTRPCTMNHLKSSKVASIQCM
jgi:hypothetical protein